MVTDRLAGADVLRELLLLVVGPDDFAMRTTRGDGIEGDFVDGHDGWMPLTPQQVEAACELWPELRKRVRPRCNCIDSPECIDMGDCPVHGKQVR